MSGRSRSRATSAWASRPRIRRARRCSPSVSLAPSAPRKEDATAAGALALLRWCGCTANAPEFDALFGDDVAGRAALIAGLDPFVAAAPPPGAVGDAVRPLARMHCETGARLVSSLGVRDVRLHDGFADLFEHWDGGGLPDGKAGLAIAPPARLVALAGDLEVFARVHGLPAALRRIEAASGTRHEPALVEALLPAAEGWLRELGTPGDPWPACRDGFVARVARGAPNPPGEDALAELLSAHAGLKQPATARRCRRVRTVVSRAVALGRGRDDDSGAVLVRAAGLHGLGRVAVANSLLEADDAVDPAAMDESLRLVPHWTERILSRCPILSREAALAGAAFERADGSGHHRGLGARACNADQRLLQAACEAAARAGDGADGEDPARTAARLRARAADGALDADATETIIAALGGPASRPRRTGVPAPSPALTPREIDVVRELANGASNKAIARGLGLSPSTVGTHLENAYRKLGANNRATATLAALERGLLD